MHKVDTPNATNDNQFVDDIESVQVGTEVDADWLNAVQSEIVNAIEASGQTLAKGTNTQLKDAIVELAKKNAGGGGGGAQWVEPQGIAPVKTEEHGQDVYLFSSVDQKLYLSVPVPSNFSVGSRIYLDFKAYSPSGLASASDMLLKTKTYLIQDGGAVSDRSNFHNATVAALSNVDPANALRSFTCDLVDANSEINAIVPQQGDTLLIELYRGADTDTEDLRFIPSTTVLRVGS